MTATSARRRVQASRPAIAFVTALRRPLSFGAVGLTVTLLGYAQLAVMIELIGISAIVAYVVQAVLSIELSYLLNRVLTWRDRNGSVSLVAGWTRFHLSRLITIPLNTAAFALLTGMGLHYVAANTVCVVVVMSLNYFAADRFVFADRSSTMTPVETMSRSVGARSVTWTPPVSIVVPVKNSSTTIRPLVDSLLTQDYSGSLELIVVGDPDDSTWGALEHEIASGRIIAIEARVDSPCRDANGKRAVGLDRASGEVLAVTDSDMVMTPDWVSTAVDILRGGEDAVAGPMIGIGDGFWADYVDHNAVASKTPRMQQGYLLTRDTFGQPGFKPPVTANFFCTLEVLATTGLPDPAFARSYEDYSWFRRVIDAGFTIRCDARLAGQHHHREGWRSLDRSRSCRHSVVDCLR